MNRRMNDSAVMLLIKQAVHKEGSQKALASKAHISEQYLSDVLNGRREIGQSILNYFGLVREVYYRERREGD